MSDIAIVGDGAVSYVLACGSAPESQTRVSRCSPFSGRRNSK